MLLKQALLPLFYRPENRDSKRGVHMLKGLSQEGLGLGFEPRVRLSLQGQGWQEARQVSIMHGLQEAVRLDSRVQGAEQTPKERRPQQ